MARRAWGTKGRVLLHTRAGRAITSRFPELATAARALATGTVLDGEIVIWTAGRLDFGAVQQRGLSSPARAAALATAAPGPFAVFGVLALCGDDLRPLSYRERRERLVALLEPLGPPLQPVPATTDRRAHPDPRRSSGRGPARSGTTRDDPPQKLFSIPPFGWVGEGLIGGPVSRAREGMARHSSRTLLHFFPPDMIYLDGDSPVKELFFERLPEFILRPSI